MIRLNDENELLACFRDLDRSEVDIPGDLQFPLDVEGYRAWLEPSGARVYLLFEDRATSEGGRGRLPKGIVFRRGSNGGSEVPEMCSWCHSVRGAGTVRLLTATSNSKKRIGIHLCNDLSCREKVLSTPDPSDLTDGLDGEERVRKILARMHDFAAHGLF